MLADFNEVQSIKVVKEKDNMHRVELTVKGDEPGVSFQVTVVSIYLPLYYLFLLHEIVILLHLMYYIVCHSCYNCYCKLEICFTVQCFGNGAEIFTKQFQHVIVIPSTNKVLGGV